MTLGLFDSNERVHTPSEGHHYVLVVNRDVHIPGINIRLDRAVKINKSNTIILCVCVCLRS